VRGIHMTGSHGWLPLRLVLCLFLLANPLLGIAAGSHGDGAHGPGPLAAAPPCHGGSAVDDAVPGDAFPGCPHCAGDGPAAACQCCDFGASSVPPLVLVAPTRQEGGPVTVLGRLPDNLPRSPGERHYRPPIDAV
jgi:hypothetical protein